MSFYLNYNDKIVKADQPLIMAANRGFRYGDGLFETMRMQEGKIAFLHFHFERLFNGMALMGFEIPDFFTPTYLEKKITELCEINGHSAAARVRLVVFRGNGTLYDLEDHLPHYIIESAPLQEAVRAELTIGLFRNARKAIDGFSHLKSNNYQPYLLGALHARKNGWGDSIILNTSGTVCESTISNVFIVKTGIIITPSLMQGCVAGIMRKHLLQLLPTMQYEVLEDMVTIEMLRDADEVFLTNSVQGIRPVSRLENIFYKNDITTRIQDAITR